MILQIVRHKSRCQSVIRVHNVLDRRKLSSVPTPTSEIVVEFPKRAPLILSFGKLARFADGSCVGSIGSTSALVTTVCPQNSSSSAQGFVPLTVDYRQKAAAAGRIPTNFLRKELGPSEKEILTARVIDRSLRPLFPKGFTSETQVIANLLAVDGTQFPDVVALNSASAALSLSDIPWNGPVGAVRVGYSANLNEFIVNPSRKQLSESSLNLLVTGTKSKLTVMLEAEASNIDASMFLDGIYFGLESCQLIAEAIHQEAVKNGKPKRTISEPTSRDDYNKVLSELSLICLQPLRSVYSDSSHDKKSRDIAVFAVRDKAIGRLKLSYPNLESYLFYDAFSHLSRTLIAEKAIHEEKRVDGRHLKDIRPIGCQVDLHDPLHGSALFQRGQTQVMCTVALDSLESALKSDTVSTLMGGVKEKNFFLHYEFPPYATNEIGRMGPTNRRELGHGALAEKSLKPIIPSDYPFTIRLTSEVLESNGSSSMASVCGGSLALMDAGVPISTPAAGIAVGLVTQNNIEKDAHGFEIGQHKVLVDILGMEDYLGDMDFKIAGTRNGITALQADIKLPGLPFQIIKEATEKGHDGVNRILDIMEECISEPRSGKKNWPLNETITVPITKRSRFLGPGGINVKKLLTETGVQVSQSPEDASKFTLFAPNSEAMTEAKEFISKNSVEDRVPDFEFGATYESIITEILERGVFVQLHPNMKPAFIPNSQLDARKISDASVLGFKEGQKILVRYYGSDPATGAVRLSRKVLTVGAASAVNNLRNSANPETSRISSNVETVKNETINLSKPIFKKEEKKSLDQKSEVKSEKQKDNVVDMKESASGAFIESKLFKKLVSPVVNRLGNITKLNTNLKELVEPISIPPKTNNVGVLVPDAILSITPNTSQIQQKDFNLKLDSETITKEWNTSVYFFDNFQNEGKSVDLSNSVGFKVNSINYGLTIYELIYAVKKASGFRPNYVIYKKSRWLCNIGFFPSKIGMDLEELEKQLREKSIETELVPGMNIPISEKIGTKEFLTFREKLWDQFGMEGITIIRSNSKSSRNKKSKVAFKNFIIHENNNKNYSEMLEDLSFMSDMLKVDSCEVGTLMVANLSDFKSKDIKDVILSLPPKFRSYMYHYRKPQVNLSQTQVGSAFIWFDGDILKSISSEELCLKLQNLRVGQRNISMDIKPSNEVEFQNCLSRSENNTSYYEEEVVPETGVSQIDFDKNSLTNMVQTTLGLKWATRMIQEIDENVIKYQEYQKMHKKSMEFARTTNSRIISDQPEKEIESNTVKKIQDILEISDYMQTIENEIEFLRNKHGVNEEDNDELFEEITENYGKIKDNLETQNTFENPDDIIDWLSATLYDCYTYELEKCLTAPLNDWLMNEKLLGKATIRDMSMTKTIKAVLLEKHENPDGKLHAKMDLFESILNSPDSKFRNSLLQCNDENDPWLTPDLKNHFQNMIQKFKEAKAGGENVKWQGYIDIQKITQAKQIEIYNEIKAYKNYVKYLNMSKFGRQSLQDQNNKKRQQQKLTEENENNDSTLDFSQSELIEIREDAFKQVDSEILTQRLRFNNQANEMANLMWKDRLENPLKNQTRYV